MRFRSVKKLRSALLKFSILFLLFLTIFLLHENLLNFEIYEKINQPYNNNVIPFSRPVILVVVESLSDLNNYKLAQKSLECYCKIFNYTLIRIAMENDFEMKAACPQKDIMFQRHCVTIKILRDNPQIQYLLFLDADMGVINPFHLIENYIQPEFDLLFYERIFDYEIMAGTYLIKNTPNAIKFLQAWVDYEPKMPKSFNGRDNAALHQIFVDFYKPFDERNILCRRIWENSKNWDDYWKYVACIRLILGETLIFDRIKIIPKSSKLAWARDGWLLDSKWSNRDFIFHGWKERTLSQKEGFGKWPNPFAPNVNFPLSECSLENDNPFKNWKYNCIFIKSDDYIQKELEVIKNSVKKKYLNDIKMIIN